MNDLKFHYNRRLYHFVGTVFDERTRKPVYIFSYYGKYKQWWHYEAWSESRCEIEAKYNEEFEKQFIKINGRNQKHQSL